MQHPTVHDDNWLLAECPLDERILVALAQQPWASGSDLAKRLGISASEVNKTCSKLRGKEYGLIAVRELGVTRRSQRRYVLSRKGVMHVTRPFSYQDLIRPALPLTWQMTEDGVTRMLLWIPMIESLYEILPTFWTGGLARPFEWQSPHPEPSCSSLLWLGKPTLTEILWLPRGRLHVAATWRFDRPDQLRPRYYSLPFFWAGLLAQEDYRDRSLRLGSEFIRSPRHPTDYIWWDIEPPAVAIGLDTFAAFRARWAYGDDVQVGSVDTGGTLVWSAEASHSEWTLGEKAPAARSIGYPEAAAIAEGPSLVNLGGLRENRIIGFVSQFRAATESNFATAFRMSRGAVTTAARRLVEDELVGRVEENLYVTEKGLEMLADRDRVDADRLVEVTYADPEGADAKMERRHDAAVAQVAAKFWGAGLLVVAGWRWVVTWHDGQIVADLWVQVPVPGREEGLWVPVEIEFSAKGERRIQKKLRSYRLASIRLDQTFPILVITGEKLPAQRFDDLAGDLTILTTTLQEFLTGVGVWEGPKSVWRRKGRSVGLSSLAEQYCGHLRQQLGRSLDYSDPSPEVFARLWESESIWSDSTTEGWWEWDSELSPSGPEQGELDQELNEAGAGSPEEKPVSPPSPTSPPPEPAATARDQAIQRWKSLRNINRMVADADAMVASRLKSSDLTNRKRLCLQRVRAIIYYGAMRHFQQEERLMERAVLQCLQLQEQHHREVRSGHPLWWLTASPTDTDPRQGFKDILKEYPNTRQDACKEFDKWARMVDRAVRTARKARRTLE